MAYKIAKARELTQRRCIKSMKESLNIFEQGKFLNDKRLLTIWKIVDELEREGK